jgi:hypothetical protein
MKRKNKNSRFPIGHRARLSLELLESRMLLSITSFLDGATPAYPLSGEEAIQSLGAGIATIAQDNHLTTDRLIDILKQDPTLHIDATGRLLYADSPLTNRTETILATSEETTPENGPYPYGDTFLLHSRPGCSKVIYLDFNGHTTPAGTAWNSGYAIVSAPFDTDGNPGSFSNAEQDTIQRIWQRVMEDYSPFDVDVTTQDPGDANLTRSSSSDQNYGIRCVISPSSAWYGNYGGVAYVNVFSATGDYYKPCFVFADQLSNNEKSIAEAVSHEVGHTLGLHHDDVVGGTGYYQGHGSGTTGWSTIMGSGYYQNVVQWSKGQYYNATNTEDDLYIITTGNGFGYRTDDHGDTRANASTLSVTGGTSVSDQGVIERNTDLDMFTFNMITDGFTLLSINPFTLAPDLDIQAKLYDSAGAVIATSNPTSALDASFSQALSAGTYFISVEGIGVGTPLNNPPTGYTDYGSLGQYWISGTINYDTTPPSVTINQDAMQSDPAYSLPINFAVVFSEPVNDFATGDVTLNGTAGATTALVSGSGTTYNVAVSGMASNGTVIAFLLAGVAHDAAGNPSLASTSTDNTVTCIFTDPFEPNDIFSAATDFGTLGSRTEYALSIHAAYNDDYYKLTAAATGTLIVDINFTHSQGDLDLYLYNSSQSQLARSTGTGNNEHVSFSVTAGQLYYIKVIGYNGAINPNYNLVIDGPVALAQDRFESNDSFAAAANFGTLTSRTENNLSIHAANNDDYYKFIPAGSGSLNVDINFTHALGDLDLFFYNSGQSQIAISEGTTNNEHVSYSVTAGQTYYIKVIGYSGATNPTYNLVIDGHNLYATWDGGSLVNNLWTTPANWVGDVAPLPGDNLVFPAVAAQPVNYNDYPSGTAFGSVTVSGSSYHFLGNAYQSSTFEVQPSTNVEVNSIYSGTLTLGAGSVLTISAISPGLQSQGINKLGNANANTSINIIKTDPISVDASSPDPALAPSPVVIDQSLPAESIDLILVSVVIDQPLPAETFDPLQAPPPVIFEQPLPADSIDLAPERAPVALNLSLSAKPVEIRSARELNSTIRDVLFSQPEQEVLFPTARMNLLSNDASGKSPDLKSAKQSNSLLAVTNVARQRAFVPRSIPSIALARDLALQQALHDDWRQDWLWNDDLEKNKKRPKDDFNSPLSLAWASILK